MRSFFAELRTRGCHSRAHIRSPHTRLPVSTFSRRSAAINSRSLITKRLVHAAASPNGSRLAVGASHHADDPPIWTPLSETVRKRGHASAVITHQSRREPWTDQVALPYHVTSPFLIASNAFSASSRVRNTVLPMSACSKIIWSESVVQTTFIFPFSDIPATAS